MSVSGTVPPIPATGTPWGRVILGGLLAAVLLRACAIEAYRIPSNSMERTLLVGDFVLVSKLAYGPRIAGTRLPGLDRVRCGDVVVFNHPPARGPISERAPYIKRVVGLPGDTLSIRGVEVARGGMTMAPPPESLRLFDLTTEDGFSPDSVGLGEGAQRAGRNRWIVTATPSEGVRLAERPGVVEAAPFVRASEAAPFPAARRWPPGAYGPLRVPSGGWTMPLNAETVADYRSAIERHEGVTLDRVAGGYRVDGAPADSFTFRQNYLFVLGDNRDDSADSRAWGFVPMSHVIGRAKQIYFSIEEPVRLPGMPRGERGEVRWERIGRPIARSCEAVTD